MKNILYPRLLAILCSCAALLATQLTVTAQTLTHRYSFFGMADDATNATDTAGTANGAFGGDANVNNGQLILDASGYVQLPAGIITNDLAVTVEAWGNYPPINEQGLWGNLFDFGTQDSASQDSYSISLCVNISGSDLIDAAISDFDNANVNRQNCDSTDNPIAGAGDGQYIAAVFNPPLGYIALYINGSLNAKIPITNTITPGVRDLDNLIGFDNWNDAKMIANLDEFRIWNGALSSLEVAASYQNGDVTLNTNYGTITGVQVSAGSQVVEGGQEPATVLATASLITNSCDVTPLASYSSANTNIITVDASGGIHGIALGSAAVTAIYGGQSNSVTVTVIEPVSILSHRYSFNDSNTVVKDLVGTLDGNLIGTAYETNGQVYLDGTSGYVDLSSNLFSTDGIISGYQSATVDYWATFGTLGNWNYAWAFGNTVNNAGANYIHSVARDGNTQHEIDNFTSAGGAGFAALGDFADETVHCTTVIDVPSGHLAIYTNGVLSGYVTNDFAPLNSINTNIAYIGHSLWTADPLTAGSFNEFRVYNGTLTPQQIALADALGPNNTNVVVGALQSIQIALPSTMQLGDKTLGPVWADYANITNYNVTGNSLTPLFIFTSSNSNVVYQASDGNVHAVGLGTATVTAKYNGLTSSQTVNVVHTPTLVNRYSFHDPVGSTNAADSVGGTNWTGIVFNGGTFTGTNLELLGASIQYVQLPSGILSNYPAVTIDMWCSFPDDAPVNCMLWAFGNTDTNTALPWNGENYIFCAPQGGRIAISGVDPGFDGEQGVGGAGDFTAQTNLIHVTSVFDPPAGLESFYTNGVLVGQNAGITIPMSYVESVTNFIGHSLYTGDPHEDLNLTEFRIYNGALSAFEVAESQALGPAQLLSSIPVLGAISASGGNVVISWPVSDTSGFSLYSSPTLGTGAVWTPVTATPTVVGQNYQVTVSTTGGSKTQFYELKN
ncbi:MAG TPA: LamG-like jellyroll fold domain-containing protein [Verrucomicrobiae bacterium]|nr:LamG-like jellyroll fold domain-containing protein [Verrucomicrobiae bacterium]